MRLPCQGEHSSQQHQRPGSDADLFLAAAVRTAVNRHTAGAAHSLKPGDRKTSAELLKLFAQFRRSESDVGVAQSTLEHHVGAMLQDLNWVVGNKAVRADGQIGVAHDQNAAELRDDELHLGETRRVEGQLEKHTIMANVAM